MHQNISDWNCLLESFQAVKDLERFCPTGTRETMANTFIDNREAWLRMSGIDYLGQFIKTWLAFNAWYRGAYTETQDRKIKRWKMGLRSSW